MLIISISLIISMIAPPQRAATAATAAATRLCCSARAATTTADLKYSCFVYIIRCPPPPRSRVNETSIGYIDCLRALGRFPHRSRVYRHKMFHCPVDVSCNARGASRASIFHVDLYPADPRYFCYALKKDSQLAAPSFFDTQRKAVIKNSKANS
uniref:Secreted protein n=1 Tax=Trichogramma kaykai TaxID=54128 RepID=A0ABD2XD50_9HYME